MIDISVGDAVLDMNGLGTVVVGAAIEPNANDMTAPDAEDPANLPDTDRNPMWEADATQYSISFWWTEAMDRDTAGLPFSYMIDGNFATVATLEPDGKTVTLIFGETDGGLPADDEFGIPELTTTAMDINENLPADSPYRVRKNADDVTPPSFSLPRWAANCSEGGYAVEIEFLEVIDKTSASTAANYSLDPAGIDLEPDEASLGSTGLVVTTLFNAGLADALAIGTEFEVVDAVIKDVNGNAAAELIGAIAPNINDVIPPVPITAERVDETTFTVVFSEAMDQASAETIGNYTYTAGDITGIDLLADGMTVTFTVEADPDLQSIIISSSVTDINGLGLVKDTRLAIVTPAP
jgi:hypothetical protein